MKRLFVLLAALALVVTGCKGGSKSPDADPADATDEGQVTQVTETAAKAGAGQDFTFDELFRIFSIFGDNIMSAKFAPQSVKDAIKDELKESYEGHLEFIGPCNHLAHDLFDGNCYDGFEMACYRYKADDHVLVLLSENGGCDVSSVRYIRAYEYDPEKNDAHEIEFPLNPKPSPDDFEDMVRLAGSDVASLRGVAKAGLYDYEYRPDGLLIRLNDLMDFDEHVFHGALWLDYQWNGSEFVRNRDYVYPCIHADGFASILLDRPAPNFRFDYDPMGYDVTYSQGGDLWIINRGEEEVLQVQMENRKVYSVEVFSPRYCVTKVAYEAQPGKQQPRVGACINDCITFGEEAPQVWMLMDGTIKIEDDIWSSKIAFFTSKDALVKPVEPSYDGPLRLENPKFKPDARIQSIMVWREQ